MTLSRSHGIWTPSCLFLRKSRPHFARNYRITTCLKAMAELELNGNPHQEPTDEGFFATSDIAERPLKDMIRTGEWDDILKEQASTTNTVSLSRCELSNLPSALPSLVQLTRLYLTYNNLRDLPDEFERLRNLTILNIGFNEFESIPSAIFRLDNLQVLFVKSNQLTSIGDGIRHLTNLEELYLNNNKIGVFPESLCRMANLRLLTMANNAIQTIPTNIKGMKGLKVLKMRSNQLTKIPDEFGELKALDIACFAQNMIDIFPFDKVDDMRNLRDLCLYANRLRDKNLLERCMYQMEERGGLFRAEENRVMLPRMGGVCDSPLRIWKYDIVWLHDGEKSVQSWINTMSEKLRNKKLTPQDYSPNDKLKTNNLKRSRIVAVYCTVGMCELLRETCPGGAALQATLAETFRLTPVGNKEPAVWVILDTNADVSQFFYRHNRSQNVLLRQADDGRLVEQLVNIIYTGNPSPPESAANHRF
ncbi:leucine-rich repeat-containing protein 1-like isoform X2 [Patiria miniata]|uniref:Disease resistance R13L4/SHOC-2-like LRR domain-containing protein n=1 Tax=Patiria miniata TaxID=46514 RepID=A0A914BLY3_PATMI|nr:leucine-rich repeat-containing protein 1-like isoform X2 [Patiria miniata]